MIALLFPGQGTQKIGMLSAFVNAFPFTKQVLEEIEDATSTKVFDLTENATLDELSKTNNAQIAIFTSGVICLAILQHEYGFDLKSQCKYLAGHSLGEYTALYASGVFSLSDMSKLVKKRGELMAQACQNQQKYQMTAILGSNIEFIETIISENNNSSEICVIANDNSSSQVVLSGHTNAVNSVIEKLIKKMPSIKAIKLNTSGAFHSPLMSNAAIELDRYLETANYELNDFAISVISNVNAMPILEQKFIHSELINQMVSRVRWRETIDVITQDNEIDKIIEISPGHVLSSMLKRDYPNADVINLETVNQIDNFMKG